jgi:hypothetical protein
MPRYNHALGRKVSFILSFLNSTSDCLSALQKANDLTISSDIIKSGKNFVAKCKSLHNLQLLAHRINEVIHHNDPIHYGHACQVRQHIEKKFPFTRTTGAIDMLTYEGRQILFNVRSPEHSDRQDPKRSWALLAGLGYHREGYLVLPELGLRIRLEPGDILAIRGRIFRHYLEDWTGGQRICIPHYTHSSIWRLAGMGHLVGLETLPTESEDEDGWEDLDDEDDEDN